MRIKRAHLINACQYSDFEVSFHGDVIGIIGPVGSGKSNLTKLMGTCVHGEFPKRKDRCVKTGAEEGEIEVDVIVDKNTTFRSLHYLTNKKSKLKVNGALVAEGADAVNGEILQLLQTEKSILEQIVFVPQEQIAALLFSRQNERDRMIQKFFGIERANKIEKDLAAIINGVKFFSIPGSIAAEEKRLSDMKLQVEQFSAQLTAVEFDPMNDFARMDELGKLATLYNAIKPRIDFYEQSQKRFDEMVVQITSLQAQVEVDEKLLSTINGKEISDRIVVFKRAQADTDIRNTLLQKKTACMTAIKQIAPVSDELIEGYKVTMDTANQASILINGEIRALEKATDVFSTGQCQTCGTKLPPEKLEEFKQRLEELRPRAQKYSGELAQVTAKYNQFVRMNQDYLAESARVKAELGTIDERLASLSKEEPHPGELLRHEKALSLFTDLVAKQRDARNRLDYLKVEAQNIRKLMDDARKVICDDKGQLIVLPDIGKVTSEMDELVHKSKRYDAIQKSLAREQARVEELEKALEQHHQSIEYNRKMERFVASSERIRTVFRYDGAPRVLVTRYLQGLQVSINHFLEMFGAEFRVSVEDGLNFKCEMSGGAVFFSDELSGGQKTELSVAFRLAACETFARSVGLLVMDEPTLWLGRDEVAGFGEIIEFLKKMAKEWDMQFIIPTHEDSLIGHFDQVIDITNLDLNKTIKI